jgi:hypothetical protein
MQIGFSVCFGARIPQAAGILTSGSGVAGREAHFGHRTLIWINLYGLADYGPPALLRRYIGAEIL